MLTKCPLTQGPIKALYDAVTSGLQTEVSEIAVDTEPSSACYRVQVLTPGELSIIQKDRHVLTSKDRSYSRYVQPTKTKVSNPNSIVLVASSFFKKLCRIGSFSN